MDRQKESWVLYGKAMMLLAGMACFALGWALPLGMSGLPLRLWLWAFGLLNFVYVFRER